MSDSTDTIEQPTAFVRYARKGTPDSGNEYDKHEASISIPVPMTGDGATDINAIAATLADAKVEVWTALGVQYEVKDGELVEVPQTPTPRPASSGGGGAQRPPAQQASAASNGYPNLPDMKCGLCDSFTFNNTKGPKPGSGKGPDFKCKNRDCGAAMWLNKDGSLGDFKP